MVRKHVKVSAPGSVMLMGEHAVLRGNPALVAAVNERITVAVLPRDDDRVLIESEIGAYCKPLGDVQIEPPFEFVLAAVLALGGGGGLDIQVQSSFSSRVGLGSSAAVTVASVAALLALQDKGIDPPNVFALALESSRRAQKGKGSGADVAASTYGGVVRYLMDGDVTSLDIVPPVFSMVYCGYKKPTPEVIEIVHTFEAVHPNEASAIFAEMEKLTIDAEQALLGGDADLMGHLMNRFHACQQALGVSNEDLDRIAAGLSTSPGISGAKISGSGLGDCVIGFGSDAAVVPGYDKISVHISNRGVRVEED